MNTRYGRLLSAAVATLFLVAAGTASGQGKKRKLSKQDKKWLEEEVTALITAEEIQIFEELPSDKDRQVFKELFWARRDLNPMTPQNEFKEEFMSRVTAADGAFKERSARGSLTDRGKIFLILGPPTRRGGGGREAGGLGPEGPAGAGSATPNPAEGEDPTGGGGGAGGFSAPRDEGSARSEAWSYAPNTDLGIPEGLTVEFRDRAGFGFRMVTTKELDEALDRIKNRFVYNPMISYARTEKGNLKPPPAQADPNSPAKKMLQAMLETKTATPDISFKVSPAFFRAAGDQVYIPMLFDIDAARFTWDQETADATLFGLVQNDEGETLYQYEEPIKLARTEARSLFEMPLQLVPGTYTLYLGIRDVKSEIAGTQIMPLTVPSYGENEMTLSSVVYYAEGKQVNDTPGTPGHAFQFGQVQFTPKPEMVYTQADTFSTFFYVYGFALDEATGKPNLTAQYIFFFNGQKRGQTKDDPMQANEQHGIGNAEIPLSSFSPGNYRVEIKVTDHVTKKVLTESVEFQIKGESE
jgi:GWxTD domain-containing protein